MKNKIGKRIFAACLIVVMIGSTFTGFTNMDGLGTVYFDSNQQIFNGVTLREQIAWHPANGMAQAYIVEADLSQSNLRPFVFNGEVRATHTVGSMVRYLEDRGYRAVAAINGDLYDTATGTPKGTVIHNGNIVTSGYAPGRVIAFDWQDRASVRYVTLEYEMTGRIGFEYEGEFFERDITRSINYFNVPFGGARGLHLFNRHYAASTRTTGNNIEVVIDMGSPENMQLQVNNTIRGTVVSVNPAGANTPIGDSQIILATPAGSDSAEIAFLIPGSEVEISVRDRSTDGHFANIREAMGIYHLIVDNGHVVAPSTGINPRTALGIKRDGSIVLYVVDGRQSHSRGLNLTDMARHMISLGSVYAFNLDGGGSSTMFARLPGIDTSPTLRNSPSDNAQRRVSNGLVFVYSERGGSAAEMLHVYPARTLAMPGAQVQLRTYATNSLFERVNVPGNISYHVDSARGSITANGLFTAGNMGGVVAVEASSGSITGSTEVEIITNFTFEASVSRLYIEPGQEASLNVIARHGVMTIHSQNSLFEWSADDNIGTITNDGRFTARNMGAQEGNIYIRHGDRTVTVPVQVGSMLIDFDDTADHWAREYIGRLAARGILSGMGDNLFMPDANLTRAQFLTMLSNTLYNEDITSAQEMPFVDVPEYEWYFNVVRWGYANGIVSGISETMFAPEERITREQMTVMLYNFARFLDFEIPQSVQGVSFTDQALISEWAEAFVSIIVGGGIMGGHPEGNFEPQGNATRAQAARVVYIFCNLRDGIQETGSIDGQNEINEDEIDGIEEQVN